MRQRQVLVPAAWLADATPTPYDPDRGDAPAEVVYILAPPTATGSMGRLPSLIGVKFQTFGRYRMSKALDVIVEQDEDGYMAVCPDLDRVTGYGESGTEAVHDLQQQLSEVYEELHDGSDYGTYWTERRAFLDRLIEE